ncbi:glycosyl hydrolase family 18 protein [Lachnospira eligens]|jgi:spore germination protein YaaH|uniref:glycosyl hydrolase family 18 protein n=1 Tax=Lachnospira eligens TaxID=39485 RepID=UPI001898FF6B|nr:glycosyl hydrolase family 18 protein [Lachnospira eligens]
METHGRKRIKGIIIAAAAAGFVVIVAAMFVIVRYTPTKEKMSGYKYFDIDKNTDKVLVMIDGESYPDTGINIDGRLYLPQEFIADNINVGFYYDKESDATLYSDTSYIYAFKKNQNDYSDDTGKIYTMDYSVIRDVDGECFIAWDYVAERTDCEYQYASEPDRLNVTLKSEAKQCVTAGKKAAVRYRGGIKSPVLEYVSKGDRLEYVDDIDEWIKVTTVSGYTGYVKKSEVSNTFEYVREQKAVEEHKFLLKNEKITLAWFQVSGTAGNSSIDNNMSTISGVNVIAPTWYSVTDASGNMSSYASADFVSKMHQRGIDVWALVSDFDTNVDFAQLYSSKAARTNMVNKLVGEAKSYGFDGINLDYENIKIAYAKDYLQFVRELSVACERNGIVLSTDNYKPEAYNRCYNLKEQSKFVDYVIVMAYDEHYAGTDAGSVASLPFVKEAVEDTVQLVGKEHVIAGIPFYTRIWTTTDGNTTSRAVGMQAAIDQLNSDGQVALWNDDCGQYVASYTVGSSTRQIWFEEEKSIEAKMQVIQQENTAGVACWKLGLEKSTVWSVISQYNK